MASEVVAVVAAVASVVAAGIAALGAARASARADGIDQRRHMVEAHDARVESFRAAHAGFIEAATTVEYGDDPNVVMARVGLALGRCEILVTNPLSGDEVSTAAINAANALVRGFIKRAPGGAEELQKHLNDLRPAVRAVYATEDAERSRLVAMLTVPRWRFLAWPLFPDD